MGPPKSNLPRRRSISRGGGKEPLVVVILLVLFSQIGTTLAPLLFIVVVALAVDAYVRGAAYVIGRKGTWLAIGALVISRMPSDRRAGQLIRKPSRFLIPSPLREPEH